MNATMLTRDAPFAPALMALGSGSFRMGRGTGTGLELLQALGADLEQDHGLESEPAHQVTLDYAFAIGVYATTYDEFDRFARESGRELPEATQWGRGTLPVTCVSWSDAQDYVRWLSERTGQRYRLPSEAEWEYAARAGTETTYWWGDDIDPVLANYAGAGHGRPLPVDSLPANPWGLHHMLGNVWEWVEDCFHSSYLGAPCDGRAWNEDYRWTSDRDDPVRILRGGGWECDPEDLRCAERSRVGSYFSMDFVGFRVVRVIDARDWSLASP